MHARTHIHTIATQGIVMSLTAKVINRRKLKEPNNAQKKKHLPDLIRRNKIFSRPYYKDPLCQKKSGINGTIKMDMERGWQIHRWDRDTFVQNKYPQQNSNERVKQEMCQMQRGAVKDGVIESVHCCTARKSTSLTGRSWAYQAPYFS